MRRSIKHLLVIIVSADGVTDQIIDGRLLMDASTWRTLA